MHNRKLYESVGKYIDKYYINIEVHHIAAKPVHAERMPLSAARCSMPAVNRNIEILMKQMDETKELLKSAGFSFSRSSKTDIIVPYFLEHEIYGMFEINEILEAYGQPVFEKEKMKKST